MLTPDDLVLVVAISEEGTVTAAAERLSTSQPAVSRALNVLERRLGTQLFERLPRGMEPTEAGRALAAHGRAIQSVTQRAERQLVAQIAAQATELVVGIVPHISIVPIARALAGLHGLDRPVRVDARVGGANQLTARLRKGELDVVIGPLPSDDADLIALPLFDDRPVLAVRAGHPLLLEGLGNDLDALTRYPWVTPPSAEDSSKRLRLLFQDAELDPPRPAIVTRDVPLAATIAGTSDFITMLPRDVAMIAARISGLKVLPIELPGPPSMIGALQRRDVPHGIELKHFVDALRSELAAVGMR
jgi:DNA-binding transcriptional LysR family regulator